MHEHDIPGSSSGNWVSGNANAGCISSLVRDTWTATKQLMEFPDVDDPRPILSTDIRRAASLQNYADRLADLILVRSVPDRQQIRDVLGNRYTVAFIPIGARRG